MKLNDDIQKHMCQSDQPSDLWDCSLAILNEHHWNLSRENKDDKWYLYSDNKLIFSAESLTAIESFVTGLAFTYKEIANFNS